ncbi:hypothetical protein GALMADRAFT_146398 [Galerina marginata CBS 339.88]|uniref:PPPDE domain-containing protein n=1 Tax=Galerina marginata (strain CBS 339.88) TaxID=685588 RepID=A0A067SC65_GALM3|nr:hypothetical protein GALMADRAFT_146398 [Galerina marginata CBS 339.88]
MQDSHSITLVKRAVGHWLLRLGKIAGAEATHWGLRIGDKYYELVPHKDHIELGYGDYKADDWTSETYLGKTPLSDDEVKAHAEGAIAKMDKKYHVLENNCQHFVVILVEDICEATETKARTISQQIDHWHDEWITPFSDKFKKIKLGWQQMGFNFHVKSPFHLHHHHHHQDSDGTTKENVAKGIILYTAHKAPNLGNQHPAQAPVCDPHTNQPVNATSQAVVQYHPPIIPYQTQLPSIAPPPNQVVDQDHNSANNQSPSLEGSSREPSYALHTPTALQVETGPQNNQAVPNFAYAATPHFGVYGQPYSPQPLYAEPGSYHGQVADYRRATLPADMGAYQMHAAQQIQFAQHIAHTTQALAYNAAINQYHNFGGQSVHEAYPYNPTHYNTLPTYWQVSA